MRTFLFGVQDVPILITGIDVILKSSVSLFFKMRFPTSSPSLVSVASNCLP